MIISLEEKNIGIYACMWCDYAFINNVLLINTYYGFYSSIQHNNNIHFFRRGKDDPVTGETAFRENYGRLGELRSLLGKKVPFITLTATAKKKTLQAIRNDLGMMDSSMVIGNPNKVNMRYAVLSVEESLYSSFEWLVAKLEEKGKNDT